MPLKKLKEMPRKEIDKSDRPTLVKVGNQYVNPADVSSIKYVRSNKLYIVNFISHPEPEYAFWVDGADIGDLVQYFNVVTTCKE